MDGGGVSGSISDAVPDEDLESSLPGQIFVPVGFPISARVLDESTVLLSSTQGATLPASIGEQVTFSVAVPFDRTVQITGTVIGMLDGSCFVTFTEHVIHERRVHPRVGVRDASAVVTTSDALITAKVHEVSASGMALLTPEGLTIGDLIQVVTTLRGRSDFDLRCEAEIVRASPIPNSMTVRLYGIRFVELAEETETALRRWIAAERLGARSER